MASHRHHRPSSRELGAAQGARRATGAQPSSPGDTELTRYSAQRKTEIVLRLLRGEDLDALSRELGVTAAKISRWQEDFLAAGRAGLKSRAESPEDDHLKQLKVVIGDLTIDNECLRALLRAHEVRDPLASRRSSR